MVKGTSCENCPFKKMGHEECPNYIETIWQEEGNPQPVIIKDCAPKRTLLLVQELYNKVFALQQQASQTEACLLQFKGVFNIIKNELEYQKITPSLDVSEAK